jgi:ribosome recycling factor
MRRRNHERLKAETNEQRQKRLSEMRAYAEKRKDKVRELRLFRLGFEP